MHKRFVRLMCTFLIILSTLFIAVGCSSDPDPEELTDHEATVPEQLANTATPMQTIESFIRIYYYNEGSYEDFKQLFIEEKKGEDSFNLTRESFKPEDLFPAGNESVEALLNHLKVYEVDQNTVNVYYHQDPTAEGKEGALFYWRVKKVNDNWYVDL